MAEEPGFKHATLKEVFATVQHENTRVSPSALHLSAEYLRLFCIEAIHRSGEEAQKEIAAGGAPGLLEVQHLEKVMAGLLLDF